MVPDVECFALFLVHDHESVKNKKNSIFLIMWNKDS